jgi:hypothetical protein
MTLTRGCSRMMTTDGSDTPATASAAAAASTDPDAAPATPMASVPPPEAKPRQRREVLRQIEALAASIGLAVKLEPRASAVPSRRVPAERPSAPDPAFRLTERDIAIIEAVNRFRYLRTGQIKRLLFPDNRSKQSVQKRLRNLSHPSQRYLGKILPYVQIGQHNAGADTAYFLGPAGVQLLIARGVSVSDYAHGNSGRVRHFFLEHALQISEFRVHLELALADAQSVELHRFTADYELKSQAASHTGRRASKLRHEILHPRVNKTFLVHPDALIVLRGKDPFQHVRRLLFLEIDLGTESRDRIRDKVIGYHLLRETGLFRKFGEFQRFRVLLQTNSPRRAENLRAALADIEGEDLVWITEQTQVSRQSIATEPIWRDHKNRMRSIVRAASQSSGAEAS